ncbi:MAG: hypothetical protein ACR2LV_08875 [Solirubrobacteraceae bacterium]
MPPPPARRDHRPQGIARPNPGPDRGAGADTGYVTGLALAGRWLAGTLAPPGQANELFLASLPTGRPLLLARGVAERVSLTAQGTVGFVLEPGSSCPRAAWASAAAPTTHLLSGCVSIPDSDDAITEGGPQVTLTNGRAAYVQRISPNEDQLVVSDLTTLREHKLAAFAGATEQVGEIDFQPQAVVWATNGCPLGTIHVVAPDAAFTPAASDGPIDCPVALSRIVRTDRRGMFSLLVRCPRGCLGELQWYDENVPGEGTTAQPDTTPLSLPPHGSIRARLRLTSALRARLRARGVVRVWLVAYTNDSSSAGGPVGPIGATVIPRSILVRGSN